MAEFTLTHEVAETYHEGWGVDIIPIWGDDERITEIDVMVVEIDAGNARLVGGAWCMPAGNGYWVPIVNFRDESDLVYDDTHDLRTRWFATAKEATDHATYTRQRWDNPSPWESFVNLGD
jgi:hypothetical protein